MEMFFGASSIGLGLGFCLGTICVVLGSIVGLLVSTIKRF